jgi:hypothetical protein
MGFLLSLIAFELLIVVVPLGLLYGWITNANESNKKYLYIAIQIDIAINTSCKELLNDIFIIQRIHEFGSPYETVSYVLGKNKEFNNLTWLGKLIVIGLHAIDPFHVEKAIGLNVPNIKLGFWTSAFMFSIALLIVFVLMMILALTIIGLYLGISYLINLI